MSSPTPISVLGRVVSIHLHPAVGGTPMVSVAEVEAVAQRGLAGDRRYHGRKSRSTGLPTRRQVTLVGRETLAGHAQTLGIECIQPGHARSNLETEGIDLAAWVGKRLKVGAALLEVVECRTPCAKMDAVRPGLRLLMAAPGQGVLARVVESGAIRVGDAIVPGEAPGGDRAD